MKGWHQSRAKSARHRANESAGDHPLAATCLQVVDACLLGVIFVAPLFFGGRHAMGLAVFVALACLAGVAWAVRQTLERQTTWVSSWASLLALAALLLVGAQLVPLPTAWLRELAPRNAALLPLWSGEAGTLGGWQTLSLTPGATRVSLAALVAYVLLFVTAAGRLNTLSDIERMVRWIATAAVLMAAFGLLQYFFSNGLFFWFYDYPYSSAASEAKGSFSCRNHFAHFLALGAGPLLACITLLLHSGEGGNKGGARRSQWSRRAAHPTPTPASSVVPSLALHVALGVLVLGVLLSFSRGGALTLAVAVTIVIALYCRQRFLSGTYLYALAFLGLVVVGALSLSGYDQVAQRLDDFTEGSLEQLDSSQGRRKIWGANVAAIRSGSWFGSGAGSHREIYPVYLQESLPVEYTHAENGPLQIVTENGALGAALLCAALGLIGRWCWQSLRGAASRKGSILAAAVTASLVASVVHSLVDFVWFIPACMSLTILLAACALRLSQLSSNNRAAPPTAVWWGRWRWAGLTVVGACSAVWAVHTTLGPGAASLHWDSYLRSAIAQKRQVRLCLSKNGTEQDNLDLQEQLLEVSAYHLWKTLQRDPTSARAHLRMASKYLQLFELRQQASDNIMSVDQIREAAVASQFESAEALRQWLQKAFGNNSLLLYKAYYHAGIAVRQCPLQGDGYLYLARLCFLGGGSHEMAEALVEQGIQVRPYDGGVLFEAGRLKLVEGNYEQALSIWQEVFSDKGMHQLQIIRLLSAQLPAAEFIEKFRPDWTTFPYVWSQYRLRGNEEDWKALIVCGTSQALRLQDETSPAKAASAWYSLSKMQTTLGLEEEAIESLERACRLSPGMYLARRALGQALARAGRCEEAMTHLRWCAARRPDDVALRKAVVLANKRALGGREEAPSVR